MKKIRPDIVQEIVRVKTEIRAMEAEAGVDGERSIGDLGDDEFGESIPGYAALRDALDALDGEATDDEWEEAWKRSKAAVPS